MAQNSAVTILVIEDESSMLRILVDKFKREGFKTIEAKDGQVGLKKALEELPDIIVVDILMPKMDGLAMVRQLRQKNTYGQKVPVIVLTNLSRDNEKIDTPLVEDDYTSYIVKVNHTLQGIVDKIKEKLSKATL